MPYLSRSVGVVGEAAQCRTTDLMELSSAGQVGLEHHPRSGHSVEVQVVAPDGVVLAVRP